MDGYGAVYSPQSEGHTMNKFALRKLLIALLLLATAGWAVLTAVDSDKGTEIPRLSGELRDGLKKGCIWCELASQVESIVPVYVLSVVPHEDQPQLDIFLVFLGEFDENTIPEALVAIDATFGKYAREYRITDIVIYIHVEATVLDISGEPFDTVTVAGVLHCGNPIIQGDEVVCELNTDEAGGYPQDNEFFRAWWWPE